MKNLITSCILLLGVYNTSFAGECLNGSCPTVIKPVRKTVNITREVIVVPFRVVTDTTKNVIKYHSIRSKLVTGTTVYNGRCSTCR